ncbi:hypothetical protein [Archangium sp.]|uniref:hypothetical protein n=1 Tax=Archangium sp. TaxID=1872627 RepID=UPI00389AA262
MGNDEVPKVPEVVPTAGGLMAQADHDHRVGGEVERYVEGREVPTSDLVWLDLQERIPQQSLEATVRGANAIMTMLGILIAGHLAVVAFIGTKKGWLFLAEVPWLLAGALALKVLLPESWNYRPNQVATIRAAYVAMVERKRKTVIASAVCLLLGILAATITWVLSPS